MRLINLDSLCELLNACVSLGALTFSSYCQSFLAHAFLTLYDRNGNQLEQVGVHLKHLGPPEDFTNQPHRDLFE